MDDPAPFQAGFTLPQLLEGAGGDQVGVERPFAAARVWTDTRTLEAGDVFLPLVGENFDGHDFIDQAYKQGCVGAFAARDKLAGHADWQNHPNLIAVDDPLIAYLALGRYHRRRVGVTVIGLTGSSGKTTTKDMLYAALSPIIKTQKTEKNYNNEVGVPKTLLSLEPGTQVLVLEMAMRGLDQIRLLTVHAEPDIALITNIGPAHIGLLGSLENIARAKLEIVDGLNPDTGILVINGDDERLVAEVPKVWQGNTLRYMLDEAEDVRATAEGGVAFAYKGYPVALAVPGWHNVSNALAVLKTGEALGYDVAELARNLSGFRPEGGRWNRERITGYENAWIINDAYNANPDSYRASLSAFLEAPIFPGLARILVLGGMKELGEHSERYHRELGIWLSGFDDIGAVIAVGEEAGWLADAVQNVNWPVYHVNNVMGAAEILGTLRPDLNDTLILLKGSRACHLEELSTMLEEETVS